MKATNGELINDEKADGIVITSAVAQVFGKTVDEMLGKKMTFTVFVPKGGNAENALGDSSQIETERVVLDKEFVIIGAVAGEDNIVYVNSKNLESLNINRYSQLKVKCKSSGDLNIVRNGILELGLLVSSLSDTVDQANQIFKVVKIILMLFGIIALVVSSIGMFNTMTIALLERTEEIGIMKSIGASDGAVSIMFFMESAIMGFLGGLSGVIIGWLGGVIFNGIINFIAGRFGGEPVSLFYSPIWLVLVIIISSAVVGFFTGLVPARRASKTDPLDALRYK
jgi:putative ABC transport system permease protein